MKNSFQNPALLGRSAAEIAKDGNRIGAIITTAAALSAMLAMMTPYPNATMTSGAITRMPSNTMMACDMDSIPRIYTHSKRGA